MRFTVVTHSDLTARAQLTGVLVSAGREAIAVAPSDVRSFLESESCEALVSGADRGEVAVELWERVRSHAPDVPCVIVTADRAAGPVLRAIRAGVSDYVPGHAPDDEVAHAVDRSVEEARLVRALRMLRNVPAPPEGELIGDSAAMRDVRTTIGRIAANDATVLLVGETGTGKELVAREIHRQSARSGGPFVAVNCAALPASLVESELFGHARGAFTGAETARSGLFAEASGGTILLDEIGEMPERAQAALLRVLQERKLRPVGGGEERAVDVRVIAATSTDLATAARAGNFRGDLRYRLDVVRIVLPPLRERACDVLLLAQSFLRRYAAAEGKDVVSFTRGAARRLTRYGWPGNVRELAACVHRAVVFARHRFVTEEDLPDRIGPRHRERARFRTEERVPLEVIECAHIARVMRDVGGNKSLAAQILGLDRKTLYRKLRAHGLDDVADDDDEPTQNVAVPEGLRD